MLINIENATPEKVLNNSFAIAVENILRAFAEQKHLVIGARFFFKTIINDQSGLYSLSSKSYAQEALSGLTEYYAILDQVSFYVSVDFNISDKSFKWVQIGESFKFVCGPLYFNDSAQLQKTKIVCENPLDSDFFKVIAAHYAEGINLSRCEMGFIALNGGGGSTKDIFERAIQNNEIVFCIVDNDKKHPRAPFGGTCSHFLGSQITRSGFVEILDVHEIESLVPLSTIEDVLRSQSQFQQKEKSLIFFKHLCSVDESVKFYIDHKKGFDFKTALELDRKHGAYWRPILKKLDIKYDCEYIESKRCSCNTACVSYDGFGENLLSNTLKYIQKGSLKKYNPHLTPVLSDKWYKLGKNFFSWSCGPYKKARVG